MRECPRIVGCQFFQKYQNLDAEEVERLKSLFCRGPYMDQCIRKMYKEIYGEVPNDDVTPEGKILTRNDDGPT